MGGGRVRLPGGRRGGLKIGGIGGVVVLLIGLFFGVDLSPFLGGGGGSVGGLGGPAAGPAPTGQVRTNDEASEFITRVLGDTEDVWTKLFAEAGETYRPPVLVLFEDGVSSACGFTSSAAGPFYCPGDYKAYIDLGFFRELQRMGAGGDFAQAYVLAHEVGHHVQNLLGVSMSVQRRQRQVSKVEANLLSVRTELQADCYAGVWAHHAHADRQLLEPGDLEEGMNAAGEDRRRRDDGAGRRTGAPRGVHPRLLRAEEAVALPRARERRPAGLRHVPELTGSGSVRMSREAFLAWPQKRVTLLGMSGVGKTRLANMLRDDDWFHFSVDYRIGTRYLDEPILDDVKRRAMEVPFLRELLRSDSIYIGSNITVDNLKPLSMFLGMLGNPEAGGLALGEFKRRQRLHLDAEIRAMRDVGAFVDKAREIYGYDHFLNDASGSFCEIDDASVVADVAARSVVIYLEASAADERFLIARAAEHPKPLYYREPFLDEHLALYRAEHGIDYVAEIDPAHFVTWVFPHLFRARGAALPRDRRRARLHGHGARRVRGDERRRVRRAGRRRSGARPGPAG